MERISWDQYFMTQSHLLSLRSTCTRLAVGATIVRDKRIIAGGYNGSIKGGVHCIDDGCYVIDNHCVRTIHAEMNALLQCAKFGAKQRKQKFTLRISFVYNVVRQLFKVVLQRFIMRRIIKSSIRHRVI